MAKSTAVSEAKARELKDQLEFKGLTVTEGKTSEGWAKLTLNTDEASLWVAQEDAVSKDVFGNDLLAFTPHRLIFASRNDAMTTLKVSRIMTELVKHGIKIEVRTDADDLATAEAADGDLIYFNERYKQSGV